MGEVLGLCQDQLTALLREIKTPRREGERASAGRINGGDILDVRSRVPNQVLSHCRLVTYM